MRRQKVYKNYGRLDNYSGVCPYCGARVKLVGKSYVYKGCTKEFMYVCSNYPECDTYVSCHKGTTKPKGTVSNSELRHYRISAHKALDQIWKSGMVSRDEAYEWLAKQLDLDKRDCHVAMFDKDKCLLTIYLATTYYARHCNNPI